MTDGHLRATASDAARAFLAAVAAYDGPRLARVIAPEVLEALKAEALRDAVALARAEAARGEQGERRPQAYYITGGPASAADLAEFAGLPIDRLAGVRTLGEAAALPGPEFLERLVAWAAARVVSSVAPPDRPPGVLAEVVPDVVGEVPDGPDVAHVVVRSRRPVEPLRPRVDVLSARRAAGGWLVLPDHLALGALGRLGIFDPPFGGDEPQAPVP
jgi:hypothetical protein